MSAHQRTSRDARQAGQSTPEEWSIASHPRTRASAALAGVALAAGLLAQAPAQAQANDYPTRPVSILIGAAAGGGLDYIARSINEGLAKEIGQPVVVESRPGAAGLVAANAAKNADPDGYTLWVADVGPLAVHPHLYREVAYDPTVDFTPLGLLAQIPLVLVVNENIDASNLEEFIQTAKGGDRLSYGSVGVGNGTHLVMELFQQQNDLQLQHVPYKGVAPAINDVLGGHIDAMFVDIKTAAPHIKHGTLKAFALAAAERSPALPDVPTFAELGHEGFDVSPWVGLVAPADLPPAVSDTLRSAVQSVTEKDSTSKRLLEGGFIPLRGTATEMSDLILRENQLWGGLIEELNIQVD